VYYVYQQFGYNLNRVAADQATNGIHVDSSDLQPGDLLAFYSSGSYIGHIGIYIGNNMFVHAANSSTGVIVSALEGSYASRGYEARRIIY
jgi:cell wall-associated NlpC family hydrolase